MSNSNVYFSYSNRRYNKVLSVAVVVLDSRHNYIVATDRIAPLLSPKICDSTYFLNFKILYPGRLT